jgi:hypothetical protein
MLSSLRDRGLIETDNSARWYDYRTRISAAGKQMLAPPNAGTAIYVQGGSVGAIQTGELASATVNLQVNPSVKEFVAALDAFREVLSSEVSGQDAIALIDRAKMEALSQRPSNTVIKSLLSAVPTVIQVTASLEPAYQALKAAAQLVGIQLP